MSIQKTFTCQNPTGICVNEGYYALALAILKKDISVDDAIYEITGERPKCEQSVHRAERAKRGTVKYKIIEVYNRDKSQPFKDIAIQLECSEEMVRYTIKKKYKNSEREKIIDYIRDNPLKSTKEIADDLGISYQKALRYVKERYIAEQLELPFKKPNKP